MTWWHYLLLSNLYLILFFGFYVLLLQRETFFQLNRIYLVGSAVVSFLIPVIQLEWVKQWFITQKVQQTIYSASPAVIYQIKVVQPHYITLGQVIGSIYVAGILILSIKLIWQLVALSRIMQYKQVAAAWSFFKKIKVDEQLPSRQVIVAHEEVHARQWHSADVLLIEVLMILNWFNPVIYFYRRAVKHIHEFIADRDAVKAGTSKNEYAMLLLSQTFDVPVHHLLNPFFNHSVLKQRIKMLQKNKSHYSALLKYGFSAPLFALMLALSSATINNSAVVKTIHKQAVNIFSVPAPMVIASGDSAGVLAIDKSNAKESEVADIPEHRLVLPVKKIKAEQQHIIIKGDSTKADGNNELFTQVEKLPEFVGGITKFYQFLGKNLRYPAQAYANKVSGRATVTFVVEPDGSLTDVKALRSPATDIAEEAVRVVASSPKWIPGEQNGKKVRVQFTVPVVFTMDDKKLHEDSGKFVTVRNVYFKQDVGAGNKTIGDTSRHLKLNVMSIGANGDGSKKPLLIIDGKEAPINMSLASLNPKKIQNISVFKNESATRLYGERSKDGVIVITTKK
jgi:TonB family protein